MSRISRSVYRTLRGFHRSGALDDDEMAQCERELRGRVSTDEVSILKKKPGPVLVEK